jgi:hypothetical protein
LGPVYRPNGRHFADRAGFLTWKSPDYSHVLTVGLLVSAWRHRRNLDLCNNLFIGTTLC